MNTRRFLASVVLAVGAAGLFGAGLWAQIPPREPPPPAPAIVSGVFVDSLGAPIRHAVLSVVGESLRVVVDSQGRFRLLVPPGPRLLAARALGYRPLMWTAALSPGQEYTRRVQLEGLSVVLRDITVVGQPYWRQRLAGFYHRQQHGLGKYLDSTAIARRSASTTPEIVATVPGVRVRQSPDDPFKTYISFPRCTKITTELRGAFPQIPCRNCATPPERDPANDDRPTVAVYVDGFRAYGDPGRILSQINPADVLAVEVYRGPSEIPFEFMSVDCAVIAVWTQY